MHFLIAALALIVLIIVHELGHLVAAKLTGMRVDEFGIGYPPRLMTVATVGGTAYTLNWLPFGGFVKIHGENGMLEPGETVEDPHAFSSRPRLAQAVVLVAGITMNLLFAYLLVTGALISGTPRALSDEEIAHATHLELAVSQAFPGTPAEQAGIQPGDILVSAEDPLGLWHASDPASFSSYIGASGGSPVTLHIHRGGADQILVAVPRKGIIDNDPSRYAIGVEVATIGVVPVSFGKAVVEGFTLTWGVVKLSASGLWHFFAGLATFKADLSQVAGPVGITVLVGSASTQGLGDLLSIIAVISVSLALINLVPIPALDGGRLLIVLIEGVIRRPINPHITNAVNTVAFALLIPLMVIVSFHDVVKLLG